MTFAQMNRLQEQMDRLFNRALWETPREINTYPALNVWEDKETLFVEAELPGMTLEDLDIQLKVRELVIRGERKAESVENATWHRRERGVGKFHRVLHLPVDIDRDRVEARFQEGVLSLTLPKAETAKPRKIEVKVL